MRIAVITGADALLGVGVEPACRIEGAGCDGRRSG